MQLSGEILNEIKKRVHRAEPDAKIILYGSYARGDANEESDIDLLILLQQNEISFLEKQKIAIPLFRLGYQVDQIISPMVQSQMVWETKYHYTPLYENIKKEGIEI